MAVVTNSSANSTALDLVQYIYDYIAREMNNDSRIGYQIQCHYWQPAVANAEEDHAFPMNIEPVGDMMYIPELADNIQMWVESYNTYHLIDGKAMKDAWGSIMPHIIMSEKNLQAIVQKVKDALFEDDLNGALLPPRLRKVRFRGGAEEMIMGFNTENLDFEPSVVSVR